MKLRGERCIDVALIPALVRITRQIPPPLTQQIWTICPYHEAPLL
jgi:hypothetical protein